MKYAFFPGCVLKGAAAEAYASMMKVSEALGIELIEIPEWTCCGASHAQGVSELSMLVINARNISIAEHMGLPIMTVCNTCTLQLKQAKAKLDEDENLRAQVNEILEKSGHPYLYQGTAEVTHFLWVLDAHPEVFVGKIKNKLTNVKVAGFYGCHLIRPQKVLNYEDGRNPESLEKLIKLLGATPIDFDYKLKCCGFHAFFTAEHDVLTVTGKIADNAAQAGAQMIVTPCPLCQMQLDMYSPEGREATKSSVEVPILHLQQLVGFALGFSKEEMGLGRHVTGVDKVTI